MATSTRGGDDHESEIHLWQEEGFWIAKDIETGVASQGNTRDTALENLDEAVALHRGETGRKPTKLEVEEMGINPDNNTTGDRTPPDVLQ